jgi:hypothetical protein
MTTSEAVQAILDSLVTNYGDIELSAEDAKQVYGGAKASKVKDLSQHNLLQYALLHAHVQIQGLVAEIEKPRPTRAQRRAAEKKGLVLP